MTDTRFGSLVLSQTEFDSCGEQVVIQLQAREGSKLIECPGGMVGVSMTMLLEVLQMRLADETGFWTVPQ